MADNTTQEARDRFAVKPNLETHFSWLKTRLNTEESLH